MATCWLTLRLPGYSVSNFLAAVWFCRAYWIAALLFSAVYAGARLWQRVVAGPVLRAPAPSPLTGDARRADIGRSLVAWYMVGGFGLLVLFSLADRGPFAAATDQLRPRLGAATPAVSFVLGFLTFVLPVVLLGLLPRAAGWPMLASARDMIRPESHNGRAKGRRSQSAQRRGPSS